MENIQLTSEQKRKIESISRLMETEFRKLNELDKQIADLKKQKKSLKLAKCILEYEIKSVEKESDIDVGI